MEAPVHSLNALFEQLGLGGSQADINAFIEEHSPLPKDIELHQADFWNESQATLLKELKSHDADWAEVVDQFDVRLR